MRGERRRWQIRVREARAWTKGVDGVKVSIGASSGATGRACGGKESADGVAVENERVVKRQEWVGRERERGGGVVLLTVKMGMEWEVGEKKRSLRRQLVRH